MTDNEAQNRIVYPMRHYLPALKISSKSLRKLVIFVFFNKEFKLFKSLRGFKRAAKWSAGLFSDYNTAVGL